MRDFTAPLRAIRSTRMAFDDRGGGALRDTRSLPAAQEPSQADAVAAGALDSDAADPARIPATPAAADNRLRRRGTLECPAASDRVQGRCMMGVAVGVEPPVTSVKGVVMPSSHS